MKLTLFQKLVLRALALIIRQQLYERQYWANTAYQLVRELEKET